MNEQNLAQRKFYVLKDSNDDTDPCTSYFPGTLENRFEFMKGISKAEVWKEKTVFKLDEYTRGSKQKRLIMTDFIKSPHGFLIVSNRFKELLSTWNLGNVEYLPVQIESFKIKDIVADDYWIINALERYDAVDLEKSKYKPYYANDPSDISEFQKLVLKEGMIPELPSCFRLKNYQKAIIIDKYLLKAIQEAGMTGMQAGDLKGYKSYSSSGFVKINPAVIP